MYSKAYIKIEMKMDAMKSNIVTINNFLFVIY